MQCFSRLPVWQSNLNANFIKRFSVVQLANAWVWKDVCILSLLDNQLLIGGHNADSLYIYNIDGSFISTPVKDASMFNYVEDAAWAARNRILYTKWQGSTDVLALPTLAVIASNENSQIKSISVSADGAIYASARQRVLTLSDGGVTWLNIDYLKPADGKQCKQVIKISNLNQSNVFWILDEHSAASKTRASVSVCEKSSGILTCREVFNIADYRAKIAYDSSRSVLLFNGANKTVHVFNIDGRYGGRLKILGVKEINTLNAMAVYGDVLCLGTKDGSIMIFKLSKLQA